MRREKYVTQTYTAKYILLVILKTLQPQRSEFYRQLHVMGDICRRGFLNGLMKTDL